MVLDREDPRPVFSPRLRRVHRAAFRTLSFSLSLDRCTHSKKDSCAFRRLTGPPLPPLMTPPLLFLLPPTHLLSREELRATQTTYPEGIGKEICCAFELAGPSLKKGGGGVDSRVLFSLPGQETDPFKKSPPLFRRKLSLAWSFCLSSPHLLAFSLLKNDTRVSRRKQGKRKEKKEQPLSSYNPPLPLSRQKNPPAQTRRASQAIISLTHSQPPLALSFHKLTLPSPVLTAKTLPASDQERRQTVSGKVSPLGRREEVDQGPEGVERVWIRTVLSCIRKTGYSLKVRFGTLEFVLDSRCFG